MTDLQIIAFVASPLQLATFKASSHYREDAIVVGHRGMKGNLQFDQPVLNDGKFLAQLDRLIGSRDVEVFLPNSVNGLFFLCACHPRVKRISYLDEGRLTWRFLQEHHKKPRHPGSFALRSAFGFASKAPQRIQPTLYRALCTLLKRTFAVDFMRDPESYRYQTIDRHWKKGPIICHAPITPSATGAEFVDLLRSLDFPLDYTGAACIFLHPGQIPTEADSRRIVDRIRSLRLNFTRVLIRPHPLFSTFAQRLETFKSHLEGASIPWQKAELSEQQEVAIELYARGVRTFVLTSDSTVGDTTKFFPSFFRDLQLIRI